MKTFAVLISMLLLLVTTSCVNVNNTETEKQTEDAAGFTLEQKTCMGLETMRSCTWCGDYQCVIDGKKYKAGDTETICGIGPRWNGGCPSTTELGDGSKWQFKGNCNCV